MRSKFQKMTQAAASASLDRVSGVNVQNGGVKMQSNHWALTPRARGQGISRRDRLVHAHCSVADSEPVGKQVACWKPRGTETVSEVSKLYKCGNEACAKVLPPLTNVGDRDKHYTFTLGAILVGIFGGITLCICWVGCFVLAVIYSLRNAKKRARKQRGAT